MERVDVMLEPVRAFLVQIGAFLPRLALALAILVAGYLLAKAARLVVGKALGAINFHIVTERSGLDAFLQRGGTSMDTSALFARLVYWLVILAALIVAFNSLGLAYVTELLGKIMLFVPRLIIALVILSFGAYFARFVANAVLTYCRNVGLRDGDVLSRLAQYAILAFVVMIALDQVDIGGALVRHAFLILLAGAVFAVALAFGLGGKDWAAAHLEHWWPSPKRDEPL